MQESVSTNDTPKRKTRRSYTKAFKSRIVAQCNNGEKSIAQLSLDHQINANLIHMWCRQFNASNKPQRMIPVTLDSRSALRTSRAERASVIQPPSRSQIYLAAGISNDWNEEGLFGRVLMRELCY